MASGIAVAAVTAVVCLAPYATVSLPYRWALYVQAGLLVAAVCGLLVWAAWPPGRSRPGAIPRPVSLGLGCYAGAAVLGLAVAWLRGNDPQLLAGQAVSMLLLPLAALGGLLLPRVAARRAFVLSLVAATTAAAAFHLLYWSWRLLQGRPQLRLYLDNKVSAVGACLLALLFALSARSGSALWERRVATAGVVILSLYVVGSGVRGLWLVTPVAVLLFLVFAHGPRELLRPRLWLRPALGLVVLACLWAAFHGWLDRPLPNLLPDSAAAKSSATWSAQEWSDETRPPLRLYFPLAARPDRAYVLRGRLRGGTSGQAFAAARWRNAEGLRLDALTIVSRPAMESRQVTGIGVPPAGTAYVEVVAGTRTGATGLWKVEDLRLSELGSAWIAPVAAQAVYTNERLRSLGSLLTAPRTIDHSLSLRLQESRLILDRLREATWPALFFGHGLGATFDRQQHASGGTNYIHNFYLFLLFKLGLVGTGLVVLAFAAWIAFTFRALRRHPRGSSPRARLAAALSAWLGYLVWSVSSPEILDFRVAPLWGLLLVLATADARSES